MMLLCCNNMMLLCCNNMMLLCCNNMMLLYCNNMMLLCCNNMMLLYCNNMMLLCFRQKWRRWSSVSILLYQEVTHTILFIMSIHIFQSLSNTCQSNISFDRFMYTCNIRIMRSVIKRNGSFVVDTFCSVLIQY